jgi:hypothetical protein
MSLFMILSLDNVVQSKRESKSNIGRKKTCEFVTLDEETKILDTLRGTVNSPAVDLIFRSYFIFLFNIFIH